MSKHPWAVDSVIKKEKPKESSKKKKEKVGLKPPEKKIQDLSRPTPLSNIDFNPFKDVPKQDTDGINAGMYGTWGTGKTSCGLDFPGPIYIIDTEGGSAKVATKEHRKKGLKSIPLLQDTKQIVKATGSIMMRNIKKELVMNTDVFFARYGIATSYVIDLVREDPGAVGTVIIDDGGELYKIAQEWRTDAYGYYEDPEKIEALLMKRGLQMMGEKWDNANSWAVTVAKIMQPIRLLKAQPVNLVVISKTKQEEKTIGEGANKTKIEWEKPMWHHSVPGILDMVFYFQKGSPFTVTPFKIRKKGAMEKYGKSINNKPLKNGRFSFNFRSIMDTIGEKS